MRAANQALSCCWGAGWDSTAMLIEMHRRGIRPDLVTFADVGAEKNVPDREKGEQIGTYDFIPVFTEWLRDHDFPEPTVCVYQPKDVTTARYEEAANEIVQRHGLNIPEERLPGLARLFGNMVANHTLPGIAFGPKSCSIKWKLEAQEPL